MAESNTTPRYTTPDQAHKGVKEAYEMVYAAYMAHHRGEVVVPEATLILYRHTIVTMDKLMTALGIRE